MVTCQILTGTIQHCCCVIYVKPKECWPILSEPLLRILQIWHVTISQISVCQQLLCYSQVQKPCDSDDVMLFFLGNFLSVRRYSFQHMITMDFHTQKRVFFDFQLPYFTRNINDQTLSQQLSCKNEKYHIGILSNGLHLNSKTTSDSLNYKPTFKVLVLW